MRFEIPACRRCCLFVPLRHGILIYGYLNFFFSIFLLGFHIWLLTHRAYIPMLFRGVQIDSQVWFCYLLCALEIIFNFVLLVGAHKKNTRIIRVYYYYGIVTTLASFVTYLVLVRKLPFETDKTALFYPIEFCMAVSGLLIQCYLLLVIRSELNKLKYQGGAFRYNNYIAEGAESPPGPGSEGHAV